MGGEAQKTVWTKPRAGLICGDVALSDVEPDVWVRKTEVYVVVDDKRGIRAIGIASSALDDLFEQRGSRRGCFAFGSYLDNACAACDERVVFGDPLLGRDVSRV